MIKWRFGLIISILFLIIILKLLSESSLEAQHFSAKINRREVLQFQDSASAEEDGLEADSGDSENKFRDLSIRGWMKHRSALYRSRSDRVELVCEEYKIGINTSNSAISDYINKQTKSDKEHYVERPSLSQFALSRPHQAMACLINKVASSSLVKSFLFLDGFDVRNINSPHAYSGRLNPKSWDELKFAEEHYTKFLVVRDPLDRLASCYMDKMVTNTHWSLQNFRKQVKNISRNFTSDSKLINRSRHKREIGHFFKLKYNGNKTAQSNSTIPKSPGMEYVTRQRFLASPTPSTPAKLASKVRVPKRLKIQPKPEDIPTFKQFLQYILTTDLLGSGFESHWVPYWRACTPCNFSYDVIAKLETGEDDLTYIWKLTGLDREVPIPWENRQRGQPERTNQLRELYSGVPRDILIQIYRRYQLDYLMFGYDFNKALALAGYKLMEINDLK